MSLTFSELFRLDAEQGDYGVRTELYKSVQRWSTGVDDKVMRQEFWQSFELCSKAGQNGGKF